MRIGPSFSAPEFIFLIIYLAHLKYAQYLSDELAEIIFIIKQYILIKDLTRNLFNRTDNMFYWQFKI